NIPRSRLRIDHPLGLGEDPRRTSLYQVGGEGERRAGKPDQGHTSVQLLDSQFDRVGDERHMVFRGEFSDRLYILHSFYRFLDDGADTVYEFEALADSFERQHYVSEDYYRINSQLGCGVYGDFGGEFRGFADCEDIVFRPDFSIAF